MGPRRESRLVRPPRTDTEILASADMAVLRGIDAGDVSRPRPGASPVFLVGGELVNLRRLAREDLCTSPIGGLPALLPRGLRLVQQSRRDAS